MPDSRSTQNSVQCGLHIHHPVCAMFNTVNLSTAPLSLKSTKYMLNYVEKMLCLVYGTHICGWGDLSLAHSLARPTYVYYMLMPL
jgi:hypothetical protein